MNIVANVLIQIPHIFSVIHLKTNMWEMILALQIEDDLYKEFKANTRQDTMMVPNFEGYSLDNEELLRYNDIIYVPPHKKLRSLILRKSHRAFYMTHP
jgi:hypothetical protein